MSHLLFAILSLFSFAALLEAQWKLRENGKQSSVTETCSYCRTQGYFRVMLVFTSTFVNYSTLGQVLPVCLWITSYLTGIKVLKCCSRAIWISVLETVLFPTLLFQKFQSWGLEAETASCDLGNSPQMSKWRLNCQKEYFIVKPKTQNWLIQLFW